MSEPTANDARSLSHRYMTDAVIIFSLRFRTHEIRYASYGNTPGMAERARFLSDAMAAAVEPEQTLTPPPPRNAEQDAPDGP